MIRLFGINDKSFTTNGDLVINPVRATVHKEDNGPFYLDLQTDLSYVNDLTDGRILVANTPQGDQAFRILNITKTKNKITIRANHVFYDSVNYLIQDTYIVDRNCNDALDGLNAATEPQSEFSVISDVNSINTYRCVRKSLYEAIQVVLARWGGHLVRDNFMIGVRESIGSDNGMTVQYRKNLREITCAENWDGVVTKLMPVGYDGLLLPEGYLVSQVQYGVPYTKTVSFTQNVSRDDYVDEDGKVDEEAYRNALIVDLRQQGTQYLEANCRPKVNYTLRASLEKMTDIGDTVRVFDERLGIDLLTNVISYDYDCILGRYIQVEFGNFKQTLSNLMATISRETQNSVQREGEAIRVTLGDELQEATDRIWAALGDSYVIYDGDKILVVDSLPKETATNVIMINSAGIGFSSTGILGPFNSAWTIDGTLDMQQINVINLTADLIKGGTLKLGSLENQSGVLEVYDGANNLIGLMDKDGLKMYGQDGSYVLLNQEVGFAGYDRNNTKIYWASKGEFHMRKSVVEEEITLCNKLRFIPITIYDGTTVVNDGIGLVSV